MARRYTQKDARAAYDTLCERAKEIGIPTGSLQVWSPGDRYGTRYELINSPLRTVVICGHGNAYDVFTSMANALYAAQQAQEGKFK